MEGGNGGMSEFCMAWWKAAMSGNPEAPAAAAIASALGAKHEIRQHKL
jgi:hypothetical protein